MFHPSYEQYLLFYHLKQIRLKDKGLFWVYEAINKKEATKFYDVLLFDLGLVSFPLLLFQK